MTARPRILLYEFVHAEGWRALGWDPPAESLRREGAAMLAAVSEDFSQLGDIELLVADSSFNHPTADWTLVIAPETDGALYRLCNEVERSGGRLLGPSPEFIRITSDKRATAELLAAARVPVPRGRVLPAGTPLPRGFEYPAVLKPVDGAGSQDTWLVESFDAPSGRTDLPSNQQPRRLEEFCPGTPTSVAFLCGPSGRVALLPCSQELSTDGRFQYQGGTVPLEPAMARRAIALADRALAALPAADGYIGVDLILGDDIDGQGDRVIEVNPRMTTSYVGLRALCRHNLARAMLQSAIGIVPELSWSDQSVKFGADGTVRRMR